MKKLNIGCGVVKLEGYINIDIEPGCKPDIIRDIERGLPFDDNSIDEIVCEHTLEHIENLIFVMNEFHRVLKKGSQLKIKVPHISGMWAWIDPRHIHYFFERSFDFFIVKDYNSVNAGVNGWYKPIKIERDKGEVVAVLEVI